jgi:hypothetical protein
MDEPKQKPRFRPYFGLSQLLILTAGLAIGMASVQPWRTWEKDPVAVEYEVKVVRFFSKSAPKELYPDDVSIEKKVLEIFEGRGVIRVAPPEMTLVGSATLETATRAQTTFRIISPNPSSEASQLTGIQINLLPYDTTNSIKSLYESNLSWNWDEEWQSHSEAINIAPENSKVIELNQFRELEHRYFVVITPYLPPQSPWYWNLASTTSQSNAAVRK